MKYYIQRQLQQYGPYSMEEVERYMAQGNIVLADLARTEAMTTWMPLSQLIASAQGVTSSPAAPSGPVTPAAPVSMNVAAAAPRYAPVHAAPAAGPMPPDLHWALVLLLGIMTFGIFSLVWLIIECSFVKTIRPASNFILFLVLGLIPFVGIVFVFIGLFKMRDAIQEYYNTVEPINLRLSGVMTFFFAMLYFQHHFSRIAQWKKTGYLSPQG
jgi:hypothetical protein